MAWIGIITAIAGAALSAKTQADAAAKQKRMAVESQQRALAARNAATDVAMKHVQEFDPGKRQQNQDEITQDLTSQYRTAADTAPITAQGVQVGTTIPQQAGGADYLAAKGREAAKAAQANHNLAALFGRIGSAGQLRRNEGVGFGDAAGEIGRIGTGANNMSDIDQIGINSVQPSIGGMLAGEALGAYGMGRLATSGIPAAKKPAAAGSSLMATWL